jgi:uncharacterized membrane protein
MVKPMIDEHNPKSTVAIARHPLHPMLVPFPIVFFVSTLVTDIAYVKTSNLAWATASTWMLGAGLLMAGLAAVAGLTDFLFERRIRELPPAWLHMIGNVVAVLLSLWNFLVHMRDGALGVVPLGVTLSAIVTVLLVFNGWMGWEMVYKNKVGVAD